MGHAGRLPVLVIAMLVLTGAMFIPAIHAEATGRPDIALAFAGSAALLATLAVLIALATASAPAAAPSRDVLGTMIGVYAGLPLFAAVPFLMVQRDTGLFNAWWEMLSSLTTTGASLYAGDLLPPTLHLWRAIVGWLGGLFILIAAIALLSPLSVGGFEIMERRPAGADERFGRLHRATGYGRGRAYAPQLSDPSLRLVRWGRAILPIYAGVTVVLWVLLLIAGVPSLEALIRSMGTLSTSGVAMNRDPVGASGGIGAEALVVLAMPFALSRRLWPGGGSLKASAKASRDPELRLAVALVGLVTLALVTRPFIAVFGAMDHEGPMLPADDSVMGSLARAAAAAWGSAFTALSFLTTTGWTSIHWEGARAWSGLSAPGLMLAGLAIMGGGVATAAGGVKLLRVYALSLHSRRELEKIVHPASVAGGGPIARQLRGNGAYLAFIFFMLFALAYAVTLVLVSLRPVAFETATILSIAALTNTGHLADAIPLIPTYDGSAGSAGAPWEGWAGLATQTKAVLAAAMVTGRLEVLAVLALLSRGGWRRNGVDRSAEAGRARRFGHARGAKADRKSRGI